MKDINQSRVLLIEDEETLRSSMARALRKLSGIEVLDVSTVNEACVVLDEKRPGLVISDIDLPERTGIELIGELRSRQLQPHLIFISAYVKSYISSIPKHAGIEVYEKPISISTLRSIVMEKLGVEYSKRTQPFGAADFLQLAGMSRRTVAVTARGIGGEGKIIILAGKPFYAEDEQGTGSSAFSRLALARYAHCVSVNKEELGESNLNGTLEILLLNAAKEKDETDSLSSLSNGDLADVYSDFSNKNSNYDAKTTLDPAIDKEHLKKVEPVKCEKVTPNSSDSAVDFDRFWESGVSFLLDKDYQSAREQFLKASAIRPTDKRVEVNLLRLNEILDKKLLDDNSLLNMERNTL